jgi:hypothetical protein
VDHLVVVRVGPVEDVGNSHDIAHPERFLELFLRERFAEFVSELEPAPLVLIVRIDKDAVEVEDDPDFGEGE